MKAAVTKSGAAHQLPHSWTIGNWPEFVYPGTPSRARYLFRTRKAELLGANAVARVGRDLIFFGANYGRWLEMQRGNVLGYPTLIPNLEDQAPSS